MSSSAGRGQARARRIRPPNRLVARAGRPGKRILVVDDDPDSRDALAELLEFAGYGVTAIGDGELALDEVGGHRLVILDLIMPRMDGAAFLAGLARRADRPAVLVVSAARYGEQEAQRLGADGFLEKPFDIDELLAAVARLLAEQPRRADDLPPAPDALGIPGPISAAVIGHKCREGSWTSP
jgi:CheY-like chemotaxis protein